MSMSFKALWPVNILYAICSAYYANAGDKCLIWYIILFAPLTLPTFQINASLDCCGDNQRIYDSISTHIYVTCT